MTGYIVRRIIQAIPVLLVSSIVIFLIVHLVPGDPALVIAGPDATPETVSAIQASMGLNKPLWHQFIIWLGNVVTGDFGTSYLSNLPVTELIASRLPATLFLATVSLVLAVILGFAGGALAAVFENRPADWTVSSVSAVTIAIPEFWVGILLILGLSLYAGVLPLGGYVAFSQDPVEALRFIILPAVALSMNTTAILTRFMRSSMLEVFGEDYVRTAEAKGVKERRVVTQHVLRNALIPVLTILGIQFGRLLGGSIVIETVFAWPGIGRLLVDSISNRDYSVVQGVMLLLVVIFVVINLIVDLLYGAVDPRVRLATAGSR